jgi:uncharacterized protein (TIGR02594 family)
MLVAQDLLGQAEIPGPKTAGFIAGMLKGLHAWWGDDETPWCGVFVAHCLKAAGLPIAKQWWRARGWEGFGTPYAPDRFAREIPYGALVVLDRPPGKSHGHVGFYTKPTLLRDGPGLVLLGGNQDNQVSYASYPRRRVVYWCWPGTSAPYDFLLARLVGVANGTAVLAEPSKSEA